MTKNLLQDKSYNFALRTVELSRNLVVEKREFVLSRMILDSVTAVGAFIKEAQQGENRGDFLQNYSIANKEAFKANFWLRLLRDSGLIDEDHAQSMLDDCTELQKMLVKAIKTTKGIT